MFYDWNNELRGCAVIELRVCLLKCCLFIELLWSYWSIFVGKHSEISSPPRIVHFLIILSWQPRLDGSLRMSHFTTKTFCISDHGFLPVTCIESFCVFLCLVSCRITTRGYRPFTPTLPGERLPLGLEVSFTPFSKLYLSLIHLQIWRGTILSLDKLQFGVCSPRWVSRQI